MTVLLAVIQLTHYCSYYLWNQHNFIILILLKLPPPHFDLHALLYLALPCSTLLYCVSCAFTGHFFHVDYGFLFGRDPKPFRPQVRFTQEMVTALGGANHPLLLEFLSVSCR